MAKKGKTTNRAKAEQPANRKSSIVNNKSQVWRIFHFKERFELPEDMRGFRVSGLHYTKRFVGVAGGDEAVGYHSQFAMLQNGDGLQSCLVEGIYGKLVNLAAQHSRAKRGYLLDADDQPLTAGQIGKLLNINGRSMGKYLRLFETVKLIEKVEMKPFDMSLNEQPPRKKSNDSRDGDSEKPASKGRKGGCSGVARSSPENPGESRAPLKNARLKKRQTAIQPNGCKKVNEQKATNGLAAVNTKRKENDKAHRHNANAQGKVISRAKVKDEPPSAPTTTPPIEPIEPHGSDDPGGSHVIPFTTTPRTSLKPASVRQRRPIGTVAGDYDKYDEHYGTKVYKALGYRSPVDSPQARREICSFASKWRQCRERMSGLDPPAIDRLALRALNEAKKIGKRKANRKPAAVWNDLMDDLTNAEIRRAM